MSTKKNNQEKPSRPPIFNPSRERAIKIAEAFQKAHEYDKKFGIHFKLTVK
ncbi:hypothetical protein ONV78_23065 [Hahella sp. CR1]|uniref:hypothetical protein n=1 Tax=Hahella sp. CR1 TaxID=2992807 RepID=UPI0024425E4C|nr:hypothetical protein [Hahella sp. CR1]MDG9670638.1 hypothetical protein [Hahella sp. CR1]